MIKRKTVTVSVLEDYWKLIEDDPRDNHAAGVVYDIFKMAADRAPTREELQEALHMLCRHAWLIRAPGTYGCVD